MLLNNRTFDKRFLKSYGDLMFAGKYIGDDIFGFGTKINAIDNIIGKLEAHGMVALGENQAITLKESREILEHAVA